MVNAVLVPTLDDLLANARQHATTCPVDADCGADPRGWPADVLLALDLDLQQLGVEHDGLAIRAIEHACVPFAGRFWCVRRIRFDVVRLSNRRRGDPAERAPAGLPGQGGGGHFLPAAAVRGALRIVHNNDAATMVARNPPLAIDGGRA